MPKFWLHLLAWLMIWSVGLYAERALPASGSLYQLDVFHFWSVLLAKAPP